MNKKFLLTLYVTLVVSSVLSAKVIAQDKEKPAEQPDLEFSQYSAPNEHAFRSANLYYITSRGGFRLAARGGQAVYEYNSIGYNSNWKFIGQNPSWFIFKEDGYKFWMAYKRVSPYEVRYSHTGTGNGKHYSYAKLYKD